MEKNTKIVIGIILAIAAVIVGVVIFTSTPSYKQSALDFKEEYEKVNGTTMIKDIKYRTLNIDKNNPYVKVSIDEIANKIKNGLIRHHR